MRAIAATLSLAVSMNWLSSGATAIRVKVQSDPWTSGSRLRIALSSRPLISSAWS
jgi:hypothetical protein